MQIDTNSWN